MDETLLREVVESLVGVPRPSASPGERRAAEEVARRLRAAGCSVEIEEHPAHGTYWWPLGVPLAAGVLAGALALAGRRRLAAAVGALAAASFADDVDAGRRPLRRVLPRRTATNVVARTGDPQAERTVVVMAHHDAPHTGFFFVAQDRIEHALPQAVLDRADTAPPVYWPMIGGPALVAAGALARRRGLVVTGMVLSALALAGFVDVGLSPVSPGANDDASGVAALVGLAEALAAQPVSGVRVLLLSAGAEESFQEGILGFARRHFGTLPPSRTWFVNLESVGSPHLALLEGEGPVRMRDAEAGFKDRVAALAAAHGIPLKRGLRSRTTTDSLVPIQHGYRTATLVSLDDHKALTNYHLPADLPDGLDYGTVADAARLAELVVRDLANG